ncbi:MAG: hypothetical protein ACOH5I_22755 [Oligoflexus sp.]
MEFKEKRNGNNVINLENERRRKQWRRQDWRPPQKKTPPEKPRKTPQGPKPHWTLYLQFFLFIAFMAYMFQQCR